jgi:N utilization substance protein B
VVEPQPPSEPSIEEERAPRNPSARALAFQVLYEHDLARHAVAEVLERLAQEQWADAAAVRGAEELVAGVLAERGALDRTIAELAPAWPLVQMSAIDRNILRLGLLELRRSKSAAQQRAAVRAAVQLATRYGSDSTPRFVRGVLGRAAEDSRPDPQHTGEPDPPGPGPGAP